MASFLFRAAIQRASVWNWTGKCGRPYTHPYKLSFTQACISLLRAIILYFFSSHWPVCLFCGPLSCFSSLLIGPYFSFADRYSVFLLFSLARIFFCGPLSCFSSLFIGPYFSFADRYPVFLPFSSARISLLRTVILYFFSSHWPVFFFCGPLPCIPLPRGSVNVPCSAGGGSVIQGELKVSNDNGTSISI